VERAESIVLDLHPPYAARAVLASLAAHAIPGLEATDHEARTHSRLLYGASRPLLARVTFAADCVELTLDTDDPLERAHAAKTVRNWLDLDARPDAIAAALGPDPIIGPLVAARPGLRVIGYVDGFEGAAMTVIGQQVSLAAARTFAGRFVAAFGEAGPRGWRAFPAPHAVAARSPEEIQRAIGLTGARARTLHALAEACAGGLRIAPGADPAEVRAKLLALPGIGPWTADYLAMRALGERDAFPAGDLVLQRALGVRNVREVAALAERWRPYRAYASFHLWTEHAYEAPPR
jgi:AraC family transcriptional regulator, regulatory protein of adaptative response / DNA-3-methyladenine glycosylase II